MIFSKSYKKNRLIAVILAVITLFACFSGCKM